MDNKLLEALKGIDKKLDDASSLFSKLYEGLESPLIAYTKKKIPKEGLLPLEGSNIRYNFHGTGCELLFGQTKVNCSYFGEGYKQMGFSKWAFYEYVMSLPKEDYSILQDKDFLFKSFESSVEKGVLVKASKDKNIYRFNNENPL